jgi:type VI secretion system secreted protein VgrG
MAMTTPLGEDKLLLVSFTGQEGLSQLFNFQLTAVAPSDKPIAFESLLGKSVTVSVTDAANKTRFINGICNRVGQGTSDEVFTSFVIDIVPKLWLLTRKAGSKIFQQMSVPDILLQVLKGVDISNEISGTFEKRDYCVQYRETDYNFACRLMEEEGIYYYFKHDKGVHTMVLGNTPTSHAPLPNGATVNFQQFGLSGPAPAAGRIFSWVKRQEIRSGVYTLRDQCFELAHNPLEATKKIQPTVTVGSVSHSLTAGNNSGFELYDWPGEYAQRFDGINRGGGDQDAELKKVFKDKDRTVELRMQQEAVPALVVQGAGDCVRLTSGHQFVLATTDADKTAKLMKAEGKYVLTAVTHLASQGSYLSQNSEFRYQNTFTAIPLELPYRPLRDTPKPVVQGLQSAVVVGAAGKEIDIDKYGRVKVQFHWDRDGKSDDSSSCWVRVAQVWAGKRWGASFWPRIGQEVVIAFQEGDPDQPLIIGSVYNSDQMPPYLGAGLDSKHKNDPNISGIKSNSTLGGSGYNEWRFDDTKDKQQFFLHAERDYDLRVKNESRTRILSNSHVDIGGTDKNGKKVGDLREHVYQDRHTTIERNQVENIKGNLQLLIGGGDGDNGNVDMHAKKDVKETIDGERHLHVKKDVKETLDGNLDQHVKKDVKETLDGDRHLHVKKNRNVKVDTNESLTVGGNQQHKVSQNHALDAGQAIHIKAGTTLILEAGTQLSLKVGGNFIDIGPAGVSIKGTMVMINSGGSAGSGAGSSPTAPADAADATDAKDAAPTAPDQADDSASGLKSAPK